jgi:hypothetical protein
MLRMLNYVMFFVYYPSERRGEGLDQIYEF